MSKFKASANGKFGVAEIMRFVFERVENIVGKGENAGYQKFLLFLQRFQKASYPGSLKVGIVRERIKLFITVGTNRTVLTQTLQRQNLNL